MCSFHSGPIVHARIIICICRKKNLGILRKILLETAKKPSNNLPLGHLSSVYSENIWNQLQSPTGFRNLYVPPAISTANCLSRGQSQNFSVALFDLKMFYVICHYLTEKQLLENKSFLNVSCLMGAKKYSSLFRHTKRKVTNIR